MQLGPVLQQQVQQLLPAQQILNDNAPAALAEPQENDAQDLVSNPDPRDEVIAQQKQELEDQNLQIQQRDQIIQNLTAENQMLRQAGQQQANQLNAQNAQLAALRRNFSALQATNTTLNAKLTKLTATIFSLNQTLTSTRAALRAAENDAAHYKGSWIHSRDIGLQKDKAFNDLAAFHTRTRKGCL